MSKTSKPVNSIAPKHNLLVLLVPRLCYWFTGLLAVPLNPCKRPRAEAERKLNSRLLVAVERYFRSSLVTSKQRVNNQ